MCCSRSTGSGGIIVTHGITNGVGQVTVVLIIPAVPNTAVLVSFVVTVIVVAVVVVALGLANETLAVLAAVLVPSLITIERWQQ